ncbi:hypothetical protein SOVF_081270 [Spinacia oleracea]|uniref:MICOS complex subunit MIC19 n=1 Tax=Spinacia oleracea TaxID=3562 RepID=A0A9R0IX40_SPIOL|nr:uncharacterized protein LOC110796431 [Spinacia oleracea]XP_056685165.1 uncharacterized protein LOC110796431 [Spinacia oleracea]KNA17288.1 hypothetical protein SOVF_081270 [Spinacia oleracea]
MGDSIQISQNLICQIIDDNDKSKKKPKKTKPKVPRESQKSQKKVPQKQQLPDESKAQKETPSAGWPLQPPFFMPVVPPSTNPELEAIRSVLKESEAVLEKMQKHEENMLKQVTQRSKELHEKEFKLPQQKSIVCQSEREACSACYKEHTKDSLKCANLVRSYQDCVRKAKNLGKLL